MSQSAPRITTPFEQPCSSMRVAQSTATSLLHLRVKTAISQSDRSSLSEPTAAAVDVPAGFSALADPGAIAGISGNHV